MKGDVYDNCKNSIYAWMLCCKITNMFNRCLTKDIALMIAGYILPDFSGKVNWSKRFSNAQLVQDSKCVWRWETNTIIKYACLICLRPLMYTDGKYHCSKHKDHMNHINTRKFENGYYSPYENKKYV